MRIYSTVSLLLLFFQLSLFGQKPNIVPAENFTPARSSVAEAQQLNIDPAGLLNYAHNVTYINWDGLELQLQIISHRSDFRDPGSKKVLPCIVFIQGSAWKKQYVYANLPQLVQFAKRGYVIAMVEYRPSDIAPFPAQVQDTKTAIRFMRKNAEKYGIDPTKVIVWGDSSGGHTAVLTGVTGGTPTLSPEAYADFSDEVSAIINYYGPTDIVQMNFAPSVMNHSAPSSPEGMLIGGLEVLENQEKAQETNPINYISTEKNIPPIFIAHGDMDKLVPLDQSDLLAKKLKECHQEFEYYCLLGAGHGTNEFWTESMFDRVETFIKKQLK